MTTSPAVARVKVAFEPELESVKCYKYDEHSVYVENQNLITVYT